MSFFSFRRLSKSFQYAGKGFWYVFQNEQSFRIHLLISVVVIIFMIYFRVAFWQAIILFVVITFVLVLELINTIFEKIIDILKPRIHYYAEVVKDIMAAAVLVATIGAIVIGVLIFGPYIWG